MIDRNHELPIKRQAELLNISRGTVYYHPEPVSEADLALMRRIDELHLEHPFAGSRMLRDLLHPRGLRRRPAARRHADAAHGHRGAVPQAQHQQEAPGAPGVPVPAARHGDRAGQPGLGPGHHLHPDGARLGVPDGGAGLVQPPGAGAPGVDHDGGGLLRRGDRRRPSPATARRRSSTPTRAASSAAASSSRPWRPAAHARAWTAEAPGATTSSSSGCGAA